MQISFPIKHIFRLSIAALLAAFCLSAAVVVFAQEGEPPDNDAARFGLVNTYQAPDAADELGAGWEVITLRWDELQPGGPEQWVTSTEIDEALIAATRDNRQIVAVLIGTPAWATDGSPGTGVPRGLYTPINGDDNLWANFVKQVVNYYGNRGVSRWAIWADQDIPSGRRGATWDGTLEDYYTMVKVAYRAASEVNPSASIHLGGFGVWDQTWFSRLLNSVVLRDVTAQLNDYYFDVVTLHHYYSAEVLYDFMRSQFVIMEDAGMPLKEVWINGTNARPGVDPQTYGENNAFNIHQDITMDQQAAYIIQAYALGFSANRGARIATYRLMDDLEEDDAEAYGLLREDGSRRPAYDAYKLSAKLMGNFTFARRLEEETFPLVDYVRFTFENRVTHVAWARGETTATLLIPARTEQALLVDMYGNRWMVEPEDGVYRVVVEAAACDDPQEGCLIGGMPWFLVEEGIPDALNGNPEAASVEEGGTVPTPDPSMQLTATTQAQPTSTPLPTADAEESTANDVTQEPETMNADESSATSADTSEIDPASTPAPEGAEDTSEDNPPPEGESPANPGEAVSRNPLTLGAVLPYILVGLGALSIGFGVWYYTAGANLFDGAARPRRRR